MYLGFLTVYPKDTPLEQKAIWAHENGFSAMEVACWPKANERDFSACDIDVATLTAKDAAVIKKQMKNLGLQISALTYCDNNLDKDLEKRKFINDHTMLCIDAAAMLDVPVINSFTGRNIDKTIQDNFGDFDSVFGGLVQHAEKQGVKLTIENCPMDDWQVRGLPGTISYSPELWDEMFRRIPSKSFGLNLDPSHLVYMLMDYIDIIPKYRDRIFHVHAKDTEVFADRLNYYSIFNRQLFPDGNYEWGTGFGRHRLPGMGQVDWGLFISTLQQNGYQGALSIELEDPDYIGSEAQAREGLLSGKRHLEQFLQEKTMI